MHSTQWVSFITAVGIASLLGFIPVTAFSCSFGKEPNPKENGIIRWVMPLNHRLRCQCTSIYPGGLNTYTPDKGFDPFYTDRPLFTDLKTEIFNYFECENCSLTCDNGGTFIDDPCHCSCDQNWTGKNCTVCALTACENGGTLDETTCKCRCPIWWMGNTCNKRSHYDCYSHHESSEEGLTWMRCGNGGTLNDTTCTCTCLKQWKGKTCDKIRQYDCQDHYDDGENDDGVYTIYTSKYPRGLDVYCDMTNWPGSIVIQRRVNGSLYFNRGWDEYKDGFGDLNGVSFWLGNEKVRKLTENGDVRWEIQVTVYSEHLQRKKQAVLHDFRLSGENYTMHVKNSMNCGDGGVILSANGTPFSTYNRDNDGDSERNCAQESKGGWWFDGCDDGVNGKEINLNSEFTAGGFLFANCFSDDIVNVRLKIKRKFATESKTFRPYIS